MIDWKEAIKNTWAYWACKAIKNHGYETWRNWLPSVPSRLMMFLPIKTVSPSRSYYIPPWVVPRYLVCIVPVTLEVKLKSFIHIPIILVLLCALFTTEDLFLPLLSDPLVLPLHWDRFNTLNVTVLIRYARVVASILFRFYVRFTSDCDLIKVLYLFI